MSTRKMCKSASSARIKKKRIPRATLVSGRAAERKLLARIDAVVRSSELKFHELEAIRGRGRDRGVRSSEWTFKRFCFAALTDAERAVADAAMAACRKGFNDRECFYNAKRLVRADKTGQLQYCEGAAFEGSYWYPHGWAVINGKIVDPTGAQGTGELEPLEVTIRKQRAFGGPDDAAHIEYLRRRVSPTRVFGEPMSKTAKVMYVGLILPREEAERHRNRSSKYGTCLGLVRDLSDATGHRVPFFPPF